MEENAEGSVVFKRQYAYKEPSPELNSDKYLPPLHVILSSSSGNVQHNRPSISSYAQSSLSTDSSGINAQSLFIPPSTAPPSTPQPVQQAPGIPATIQHQYQYGTWTFQGYLTNQPNSASYQMFFPNFFPPGVVVPLAVQPNANFNPFTNTGSTPSLIHNSGSTPGAPNPTIQIGSYRPNQQQSIAGHQQPVQPAGSGSGQQQVLQPPQQQIIQPQPPLRPGLTQTSISSISSTSNTNSGSSLIYPGDTATQTQQQGANQFGPPVNPTVPTQITYRPDLNQFGTSTGQSTIQSTGRPQYSYRPDLNQFATSPAQVNVQPTGSTLTYNPNVNQFGTSAAPASTTNYIPPQPDPVNNFDIRRPHYPAQQGQQVPQAGKQAFN